MEVGKKIKVLRAQRGVSQQELAEKINKTRALISHIELSSKVNHYTLSEIANALGVSIEYFEQNTSSSLAGEGQNNYLSLSERIAQLEKENALLTEIIQNQKDLIEELKKKR